MFSNNVYGLDFGTYEIKIYDKKRDDIWKEKDVVAIENKKEIISFGNEAYEMYEREPVNIQVFFPMKEGAISRLYDMQYFLKNMLEIRFRGLIRGSRYVVAVPTDVSEVEKRAFYEIFYKSKAKPKKVLLCEKPIADAVGLDIDVNEPTGVMIVDMGADTTETSVISLGGLVLSDLLHFGGNRLDESIISYIRKEYNLVIGQKTAKSLKETIGSALPGREDRMVVVGRDVLSGLPIEMEISSEAIYEAMKSNLESICTSIKMILEKTPPELAKDIIHSGIYITGGGSKLQGLGQLFEQITGIKVIPSEFPEESAVRGLVKIVSESKYKTLPFSIK